MAVVGADRGKGPEGLVVVETATGQLRQQINFNKLLKGYTWPPTVCFSPDGSQLLVNDGSAGVVAIDPFTGELLHRWEGHRYNVNRIVFSPSGRLLATVGGDTTVLIWNAAEVLRPAQLKRLELRGAELSALWEDLAGADASKAAVAVRRLTQ